MADGLIAVFQASCGIPESTCRYLCSRSANHSMFMIGDDDPRQNPYPVRAMETANSGAEVWYSNGPGILIIDCATLAITRRLEPYNAPSMVMSITCSSECDGEEVAWCLDNETNFLVMYYTATYQLSARYFCGDRSPLRDMFTVQQPSALISTTTLAANRTATPEDSSLADLSIIHSSELGTQILTHQDSLTDYCSVSSHTPSATNRVTRSPSSLPSSPVSSSSVPFSTDCEEPDKAEEDSLFPERLGNDVGPASDREGHLQAVTILSVKDLLWIPR